MVLRGSATKPDGSLPEELSRRASARKQVEDVTLELEREEKEISHALSSVKTAKMKSLEEKRIESWRDLDVNNAAVRKTIKQLMCGGAAGAIARTTVAPMDRIKILMQVAHVQKTTHLYGSMGQTLKHILKNEGLGGLWRGNFTNCVRVVPHSAVQFVTYDKFKIWAIGSSDGKMSTPQRLLAGSLSGIAAASVTQPLDVVRIRLQTDPEVKGKVGNAVRAMWREGGILSFYKGYTPAMLSLSPFIAVNFATFDGLKSWWYGDEKQTTQQLRDRSPFVPLALGALSGIIAQTACYPLDTVRRRMQLKGKSYPSTMMAFVTIAKEEGYKGFYRGMGPNALKVMPNNAIRFAAYETLKNWFVEE